MLACVAASESPVPVLDVATGVVMGVIDSTDVLRVQVTSAGVGTPDQVPSRRDA